jgi:hypothetical protein
MNIFTLFMKFETSIRAYGGQPLTRQLLLNLLQGYGRPYDKIEELVRQQQLIPVKRGVFVPGPELHIPGPEPFLLANHLAGPSYVSMEAALSHWGLIPERVQETSSAFTGRSKIYDTALGRFSYTHLPLPYYSFGQERVTVGEQQVALVACPEKALCDKIITTAGLLFRSPRQSREWITEDMRIDQDRLRSFDTARIRSWLEAAPKKSSLQWLVKTLEAL